MASHWEKGQKDGLVSLGTYSLHLQATGPDRLLGDPVLIIFQGLASPISQFSTVIRLLSSRHRTYITSRSSPPSPLDPNSRNIAQEFSLLLETAEIKPPYIIVAHSWGGILAREFLNLREKDVVGMVFIEANQEKTLEILDWRKFFEWVGGIGVDIHDIIGLERKHRMDKEEWKSVERDRNNEEIRKQGTREWIEYPGSFPELASKQQLTRNPPLLRNCPVSIIKGKNALDLKRVYSAVVETGRSTEERNSYFKTFLDGFDKKDRELQLENGMLSRVNRFVEALNSGHDVHMTEPEIIVQEVNWVTGQIGTIS